MILRAKGMVEGKDGQWIYFDMVPGEADIREGSADYTGPVSYTHLAIYYCDFNYQQDVREI